MVGEDFRRTCDSQRPHSKPERESGDGRWPALAAGHLMAFDFAMARKAPAPCETPKEDRVVRTQPSGSVSRWAVVLAGAILVLAALAAYHNSFSGPFIWDDLSSIVDNPTIRHFSSALSPPNDVGVGGRPVSNLTFALNYALGGTDVWGYHAFNLLIHTLAGLTLFGLVRRTLQRPVLNERFGALALPLALAVAVIWTVHPLQTETVTYITQRYESMMGLFYLLTLYCFVRSVESAAPAKWQILSVVACLLGVMSKEIIVSAPVMVLLYDRTFVAGSFLEAGRRRWRYYLGLVSMWLLLVPLLTGVHQRSAGFGLGVTWWRYALNSCHSVVLYLKLAVWPHPLVLDYGTDIVHHASEITPYVMVLAVLVAGTTVALWRWPVVGFAGAWVFVILAPASSVVPLAGQPMAEHRMYLSLAAVIGLGVLELYTRIGRRSMLVFAAAAVGLGWITIQRNKDYRSELTIWSDTVAKRPNSERAHNNLGVAWSKLPGRLNDAIAQYEEALRLKPGYAEVHYNLGAVWAQMPGRLNDAAAQYEAALRLKPAYVEAHYNLGVVWSQMPGRLNDAIAQYEEALRLKPGSAEAHNNLGLAWSQMPGRLNDAIAQYEAALRLKPDFAEAHNNLGLAWAQMPGRLNDAAAQYEAALRIKPAYVEAHINLGLAWSQLPGRLNDAATQFEEALHLQPDSAEAHNNLGVAWSQLPGRLNDAAAQYEAALRLKPDYGEAHYNLGNAWSQLPGRLNDAAAQYEAALRLKPDYAEAHHNLGLAWSQMPGRLNDAIAQFKAALRLKPDFAPGWHNLGVSWFRLGNLPAAVAAFREELRLSPNDPVARQALAAALRPAQDH
jgi:tetratricopeptide (TPR) repeat protein